MPNPSVTVEDLAAGMVRSRHARRAAVTELEAQEQRAELLEKLLFEAQQWLAGFVETADRLGEQHGVSYGPLFDHRRAEDLAQRIAEALTT